MNIKFAFLFIFPSFGSSSNSKKNPIRGGECIITPNQQKEQQFQSYFYRKNTTNDGYSLYDKIVDNLILSTGTVRKHIENIYRKLQVRNKLEAVQKAKKKILILF